MKKHFEQLKFYSMSVSLKLELYHYKRALLLELAKCKKIITQMILWSMQNYCSGPTNQDLAPLGYNPWLQNPSTGPWPLSYHLGMVGWLAMTSLWVYIPAHPLGRYSVHWRQQHQWVPISCLPVQPCSLSNWEVYIPTSSQDDLEEKKKSNTFS